MHEPHRIRTWSKLSNSQITHPDIIYPLIEMLGRRGVLRTVAAEPPCRGACGDRGYHRTPLPTPRATINLRMARDAQL
jgi:hypothetical protein